MGLGEFYFAGKSTRDFNVYCTGAGTFSAPLRKYTANEIPGKNGLDLEDEKSFSNGVLSYKCIVKGDISDFERFRAFLMSRSGYHRLEDTFHPDEYRMAALGESISPTIKGHDDIAAFEVTFSALPQRFLKSGDNDIPIVTTGVIINNTYFESKPMIRVLGSGAVAINGKSFTVTNVDGYVDVDCENMDAYKGTTNMNDYFVGEFPTLDPGANNISCSVGIEIKPRWYTI